MNELKIIAKIVDEISDRLLNEENIPKDFIACCDNKNESLSVWLTELATGKRKYLAFNTSLKGKKGNKYISFRMRNNLVEKISIPESAELKKINSDKSNSSIDFPADYTDFNDFVNNIIVQAVYSYEPSDKFGCCSKYLECSNAKKCLHNNLFYAKACFYRKNLELGKIFYGENKSI